jgi:hypothetical protein
MAAQGPALVPELEEQQGYEGVREESKSQLEGFWGFFFSFCLFSFSLSGNRTMGFCLQKKAYSISS